MNTIIDFGPYALAAAKYYAQNRLDESKGYKNAWGLKVTPEQDFRIQLIGVLAEWTCANTLGMSYEYTVNIFKAPDMYYEGISIQVKGSERADSLVVRTDAKDEELYVLVKVTLPTESQMVSTGEVVGALYAEQARLAADCFPGLWRDPQGRNNPNIFVPRNLLNNIWDSINERLEK